MDKPRAYFTMSELAKALDVKKGHIRFCEKNGLIAPRTIHLKRHVYNRYDRERLKLIFRFVLLGYSKEQILETIGVPDGTLDEDAQLLQEITYGEAKIEALETDKGKQSFTKQTRIMNEIKMLREYVKNVKDIKAGIDEKFLRKDAREETERRQEPIRAIIEEGDQRKQHPVKVISVFIAGLVLVTLIGSYFYYRTGKEETKAAKQIQKKAVPREQIQIHQPPESAAQKAEPPSVAPETQKKSESSSEGQSSDSKTKSAEFQPESTHAVTMAPGTGEGSVTSEKPLPAVPKVEGKSNRAVKKKDALEGLKENRAPAAAAKETLPVAEPEPAKEKADDSQQR
jgi:DNA-binding transcriptional MerR regulator